MPASAKVATPAGGLYTIRDGGVGPDYWMATLRPEAEAAKKTAKKKPAAKKAATKKEEGDKKPAARKAPAQKTAAKKKDD